MNLKYTYSINFLYQSKLLYLGSQSMDEIQGSSNRRDQVQSCCVRRSHSFNLGICNMVCSSRGKSTFWRLESMDRCKIYLVVCWKPRSLGSLRYCALLQVRAFNHFMWLFITYQIQLELYTKDIKPNNVYSLQ